MNHTSLRNLLLCALACAAMSPALAADPAPAPRPGDPPIRKLDGHLVDLKGRGLYTWDGDKTLGKSDCMSQCRLLWPPIMADADAKPKGPFTIATRPDGSRQWALRGRPLYRWASDKKYGDAGGDEVAGSWHLVKVAAPAKPAATPAAAPTGAGANAAPAKADSSPRPPAG